MRVGPASGARASEEDLIPISALQHFLFCPRQCALIHVERLWADNRLTVEGSHVHRKAHEGSDETRAGVRIERGVVLRSFRLGLVGVADVVEFIEDGTAVRPFPVEYKRGRPKAHEADRVQLCAQAMCLEEMLGIAVPAGALFYGTLRRRQRVAFDVDLRELTESTAGRVRALLVECRTPPAVREPKCDNCSLVELCLPDVLSGHRSASEYLVRALASSLAADGVREGP